MRKFILPMLAVASLGFAVMHVVRASQRDDDPPPPVQPARSPFSNAVAGAGLVEPETENIALGSPLSGLVREVHVKVGQRVKKGDLLFRLDDRQLQAERNLRQAGLKSAKSRLDRLNNQPRKEEVDPAEAKVREMAATIAAEQDQYQRAQSLFESRAIPEEELVRRRQTFLAVKEQQARVNAELALLKAGAWQFDLDVARAEVDQARALLDQTETELDRLRILASVDGDVLQVNVRPGEFVAATPGQALIMLGNVGSLHLRADIDEHDLPRLRPHASAFATLRGDPGKKFELRFVRVEPFVIPKKSLTGSSTERVDTRVLQVIYRIESGEERLFVGQQMDLFVAAKE